MSPPKLESESFSAALPSARASRPMFSGDGGRVLLAQLLLTGVCSAALGGVTGPSGALSALSGGGAALAGTLAFFGVARWRSRPAPTPWQALRAVVLAEAAKWAVSLGALASLLSGDAGIEAVARSPGAAVIAFCVAWVAPLLAMLTARKNSTTVWPPKT